MPLLVVAQLLSAEPELNALQPVVFQNFDGQIGGEAGFVQTGLVFFTSAAGADALKVAIAMHKRIGIRESIVTGDDLKTMEPQLDHHDIACGGYEPDGGYADLYRPYTSIWR